MAVESFRVVHDGAGIRVIMDGVAHSWVYPEEPARLEFGYMQRMADYLEVIAPPGERMRVVHIGGAGMTMARYVAARRPTSPQIVLEPNAALTEEVRRVMPLPAHSGIKVRAVDGRTGIAEMPGDYARVIILDAFDDARVPAELVSAEFFAELARVLTGDGLLLANVIDQHPFDWTKRVLAGMARCLREQALTTESATIKGRRHGNVVLAASNAPLPIDEASRRAATSVFGYRVLHGSALQRFVGDARPFTDADSLPSPLVERGLLHFE